MRERGTDERPGDSTAEPLLSVLTHRHRRSVLRRLAAADDALHLADLARDLAREESVDEREAGRIYVRLYHVHVPKLREAGVVSFDPESKLAATTPAADAIATGESDAD